MIHLPPRATHLCLLPALAALLVACGGGSSAPPAGPARVVAVSAESPDGAYSTGQVVRIRVDFSRNVNVAGGTPTLALATRARLLDTPAAATSTAPLALYVSGSGTSTLLFEYPLQSADWSLDLDYAATDSLATAGATVADTAGTPAVTVLPAPGSSLSLAGTSDIRVMNWQQRQLTDTDYLSVDRSTDFRNGLGDTLTLRRDGASSPYHLVANRQSTARSVPAGDVLIAAGSDYLDFNAAVNEDGSADIFWRTNYIVYSCRLAVAATACSAATTLGTSPATISAAGTTFVVGKAINGKRHVMWHSQAEAMMEAFVTVATGAWTVRQAVAPDGMSFDDRFIEDAAGNVTYLWPHANNFYKLHAIHYSAATDSWGSAVPLGVGNGANRIILVDDANGNLSATWRESVTTPSGGRGHVLVAHYTLATDSWSTPVNMTPTTTSSEARPAIARNGTRVAAAWMQGGYAWVAVQQAGDASWPAPRAFGSGLPEDSTIGVGLDDAGNYAVTWDSPASTTGLDLYGAWYNASRDDAGTPVLFQTVSTDAGMRQIQVTGNAMEAYWLQVPVGWGPIDRWRVRLE